MAGFFKPLRRKIGVATLVIACAFAAGWVRSEYRYDWGRITGPKVAWRFGSQASIFSLYVIFANDDSLATQPVLSGNSGDLLNLFMNRIRRPLDHFEGCTLDWRWERMDFHFGAGTSMYFPQQYFYLFAVPYAAVVIPLTLLSAWLLLSKVCQMPQQELKARISNEASESSEDRL